MSVITQVQYAAQPALTPRGPRAWIAMHPLRSAVLLTFACTWVVLIPIALESHGWLPFSVPALAVLGAAWGPALAAIMVVSAVAGRRGLRSYFGQLGRWRVHPGWYAVVLLGPGAYILAGIAIARTLGWSTSPMPIDNNVTPVQVALGFIVTLALAVVINTEEFAWQQLLSPPDVAPFFVSVGLLGVVALGVVVIYGPRLSRAARIQSGTAAQ